LYKRLDGIGAESARAPARCQADETFIPGAVTAGPTRPAGPRGRAVAMAALTRSGRRRRRWIW